MKRIFLLTTLITTIVGFEIKAQQNVQVSQYMYNTLAVNPAYAGSKGILNATLLGRLQWLGFDGAPTTQTFYVHTPLPKEHMGLGISVTNDKIGPTNNTYLVGSYSYTLNLNQKGAKLSLGASAGANLLNLNSQDLRTPDGVGSDASLSNVTSFKPNFGFGAYYQTDNFYTGISTPKLLENKINTTNSSTSKEFRHFYWICGGIFPIGTNWKLKPTTMVKVVKNSPISIDLTANFLYADKLWLGVSHRLGDSFSGLVGYRINDQFQLGFAYDQTTSKLMKYNSGTYEIYISYDFAFEKVKMKSPRYF